MTDTPIKLDLLDYFALRHTQLSHLEVSLKEVIEPDVKVQAKVELNLTPREMKVAPTDGTPAYQVTARLSCHGNPEGQDHPDDPLFKVIMVVHAAYRQFAGEPVAFHNFAHNHTSLARQLYPLIQQQVKPILQQLGLAHINLPYDLVENHPVSNTAPVTSALH